MKKYLITVISILLFTSRIAGAQTTIDLFGWGFNIDGITYCDADCANLGEANLPSSVNAAGFNFLTGLGSIEITISDPGTHFVVLFLDHDIDFISDDEGGGSAGALPTGQGWEIDEPGFGSLQTGSKGIPYTGDIFDNFLDYRTVHPMLGLILLDNQVFYNLVDNQTINPPDDVSMARGWDFELLAGETATINITLGTAEPSGFYIFQSDSGTGTNVYFSSSINILGSATPIPFSYTPVTPCRIVDTRNTSAGIIDASTQRNFRVHGSGGAIGAQGGNSAGCSSPLGEPFAAHINMVAVDPTGQGNLKAFPVGAGPGAGLSVNYNVIGTNLANAGTVKTIVGTGPDITVASRFADSHAVISVLGYYYPTEDLLYTPVIPCKIVDTRNTSEGILGASDEMDIHVFGGGGTIGAQGGNPAGCSSPLGEPLAAHINMVAVDPTDQGNLKAFPVGAGPGAGLSVNYNVIGTNLANAGTVKTIVGTDPDITVTSRFADSHAVISVLGYYYPSDGLLYSPVTPCKIVDTRNTSGGILGASDEMDIHVFGGGGKIGPQGGNSAGCPSPLGEPLAAHINMVAVDPTGQGNLKAFPVGAGPGAGLSVNYNVIGTNLANAGTVKTIVGTGPDITVTSRFADSHAVISVLGYYYTAP